MKKIGITGTIAAGKSTVSILMKRHGFAVFNSDNYAKTALHRGSSVFSDLIDVLGNDVIDQNGDIAKEKMASIIFADEEKRLAVNQIVHPYVIAAMKRFFESHQKDSIVFAEVPLLFEAGLDTYFDIIIVVTSEMDTAIQRMMEDRGYSKEEALARYHSQIDSQKQVALADIVIHNDGDLKELNTQMNQLLRKLRRGDNNEYSA